VAIVCWCGDLAQGERVLKPLRTFGPPVVDWVDHIAYGQLTARMPELGPRLGQQAAIGPSYNYWRGGSFPDLTAGAIEQIAAAIEGAAGGCSIGLGHFMHGRICRVPTGETPLYRSEGHLTYFANASWGDPGAADARMAWVDRSRAGLQRFSTTGAYINYLSDDTDSAVESFLREKLRTSGAD